MVLGARKWTVFDGSGSQVFPAPRTVGKWGRFFVSNASHRLALLAERSAGVDWKEKIMNIHKLASVGLVAALALGLSACSAKSDEEKAMDALRDAGILGKEKDYGTATMEELDQAWADYDATYEKYHELFEESQEFHDSCEATWLALHQGPGPSDYVDSKCHLLRSYTGGQVKQKRPPVINTKEHPRSGKGIAMEIEDVRNYIKQLNDVFIPELEGRIEDAKAEMKEMTATEAVPTK